MITSRFSKILALLGTVAFAAPAAALDVDFDFDTSTVLLGDSPWVEFAGEIHNDGGGVLGDLVLSGVLPTGFDLTDFEIVPSMVGGETSWNTNNDTRLFTMDIRDGNDVDEIDVVVVGTPEPAQACGIYGFDMNPLTGEYWAIIGLQPPGYNDGSDRCYYASAIRDLFRVDPLTGTATWVAAIPVKSNALTIDSMGRMFVQSANGATRRGAIYEIGTDGSLRFVADGPILGSRQTWEDPSTIVFNPDDGLIHQFAYDDWFDNECKHGTVDPDGGIVEFDQYAGNNCFSDYYGAMAYLGQGSYMMQERRNSSGFYLIEPDGSVFDWDYIDSADEYMMGWVGAGHHRTLEADCTVDGNRFTCAVPTLVPRGRYFIYVAGNYSPDSIGTYSGNVELSNGVETATASDSIAVVGADLAAFASVDTPRVDIGNPQVFTVEAENLGTQGAASSQIVITVPSTHTYSTYGSTQGSCTWSAPTLTCNPGTIGAGNLVVITVYTDGASDGAGDLSVSVSTSNLEASYTNNTASVRGVVGPATDLKVFVDFGEQVAAAPSTSAVLPGREVPVTFTVSNAGPDEALDVILRHRVPAGIELDAATADAGSCDVADGLLTCELGDIAVGTTVTVELAPTPVSSGSFSLAATAFATTPPEMVPADNVSSRSLRVAPPTLTVELGSAISRSSSSETPSVLQVVVTNNGETDDAVSLRGATVVGSVAGLDLGTVRVRVIRDDNANGKLDEGEETIGSGRVSVAGGETSLDIRSLSIPSGESVTLLFVLLDRPSTTTAAVGGSTALAALGLLPLAGLVGFRRRRAVMFALLMAFGSTLPACGETLEELLGTKVQITLTGVEAGLTTGGSLASTVQGLPLEGPSVEVK